MDVTDEEKRRRAVHEAGHAIAAIVVGLTVESVTIKKDEGGSGGKTITNARSHGERAKIQQRATELVLTRRDCEIWSRDIIQTLAGGAAESVAAVSFVASIPRGNKRDLDEAHKQLHWLLKGSKQEATAFRTVLGQLQERVDALVSSEWRAVDALARLLIEKETVAGSDVQEVARTHDVKIWPLP